jgi:hypothetical protein
MDFVHDAQRVQGLSPRAHPLTDVESGHCTASIMSEIGRYVATISPPISSRPIGGNTSGPIQQCRRPRVPGRFSETGQYDLI